MLGPDKMKARAIAREGGVMLGLLVLHALHLPFQGVLADHPN